MPLPTLVRRAVAAALGAGAGFLIAACYGAPYNTRRPPAPPPAREVASPPPPAQPTGPAQPERGARSAPDAP